MNNSHSVVKLDGIVKYFYDVLRHCFANLLIKGLVLPVHVLFAKIGELRTCVNGERVRLIKRSIGPLRIIGPERCVCSMINTVEALKAQDEARYGRLIAGPRLTVIVTQDRSVPFIQQSFYLLRLPFIKSSDGRMAFFVWWSYFLQKKSLRERIDQVAVNNRIEEATLRSAEWLEDRNYSKEITRWMRGNGIKTC